MTTIKQIIFDADDTLWHNNIYFIKATEATEQLMVQYGLSVKEAQNRFLQTEKKCVETLGYGSHVFLTILKQLKNVFKAHPQYKAISSSFTAIIARFNAHKAQPPELFANVESSLSKLKQKYTLCLLTKGEYSEQKDKVDRSGLAHFFTKKYILPEKNNDTYSKILLENNWRASETCMVGNSPKSDINPALNNGMWAVFIPYAYTWHMDDEKVLQNQKKLITIENFSALPALFRC